MHTQQFIVEGIYLGQSPRTMQLVHGDYQVPVSYAFFCPHCADLWARCPTQIAAAFKPRQWQVLSRTCQKCHVKAFAFEVPGSIMLPLDHDFNHSLSDEVIQWEFYRHLEWQERKDA